MSSFTKPENALKKAEELIAVGQKETALQTLHDVITSKRHRTWSITLESIMIKYIELCVEMRKGKVAKEGLHQYKLVCQQVNVSSLEKVIKHFLQIVEENAKEAQSKAEQLTLDIEDLDVEESAESIMLTAISGEATKDRTDREIVTPWLRFLWETYRTVLEILRNNAKMEGVYHQTAEQAFSFCLRYQRKNEFRRLSDILRLHLANYSKYPNQPQNINLNVPETLQIHLETRFSQLNVATELELWQEAFRSIEDIHSLIALSGRPAKPQMMATYFQKLAQIFWVSNNFMFHAFALYKYYSVAHKNFSPEEARTIASTVLLAALSVPVADPKAPDDQYFEFDLQKEKHLRFCTLLTVTSLPKRDALLQDLIQNKKINNLVLPKLPELYDLLENKFGPLILGQRMQEKFELISSTPALAQYLKQIQKLTFLRVTQQVATVYESMTIPHFLNTIKFMPLHEAEKNLVELVKRKIVVVRIDHQNGALHFGNKAELLRGQLTTLAKDLREVVKVIAPVDTEQKQKDKLKRQAIIQLAASAKNDHTWIANRKFIIEMKKEHVEKVSKQEQELVQQEKLAREKELRAQQVAADVKDQEERIARQKAEKEQTEEKPKEDDVAIHLQQMAKAKAAQEKKLTNQTKRMLYLERAKRELEKPLLEETYQKKQVEDQKFFDEKQKEVAEFSKNLHTQQVAEKQRLSRMQADRAIFEERIMSRRRADYEVRKAEQDIKLAEIRVKLEEEKKRKQQEAEERRAEEERIRKIKEEEERKRREAEDARRAEEEASRKKREEIFEKQRQKEREIEAKQRKEEEDRRAKEVQERDSRARPDDRWGARREEPVRGEREPWRPQGREPVREERGGWGRDERGPPPRDDRDRPPPRDDRDRFPPRDDRDRPAFREDRDRPPPAREEGGGWRNRAEPEREQAREPWRPQGRDQPAREERGGGGGGGWGRDRDERGPPPAREERGWGRDRDDRGPPPREDRDRPPFRDDRDRPQPRGEDRDRLPPRDREDRPYPPRDRDDRDRLPPRGGDVRDNRDRPAGPRGDDRRPPERTGGGGGWRDREEAPRRDSGDRLPPRRDSERESEEPRRGPSAREERGGEKEREAPAKQVEPEKPVDVDGFTTVPKGRRKK